MVNVFGKKPNRSQLEEEYHTWVAADAEARMQKLREQTADGEV